MKNNETIGMIYSCGPIKQGCNCKGSRLVGKLNGGIYGTSLEDHAEQSIIRCDQCNVHYVWSVSIVQEV